MEYVMDMEKKIVCPNCGASMKPSPNGEENTYVCPDCGSTIEEDEIQNFDTSGVCPNCNQPIDGNECSYCGYYLGSDFE
jgi:DNA-directed RNA polymerase subunit RPC12/RpoP